MVASVDWSRLEGAYGPATDVPKLLVALRSQKKSERDQALGDLEEALYHQGQRFEATSVAVPFIIEVAVDPTAKDKRALLELLGDIAVGWRSDVIHEDIDPGWVESDYGEAACFRAVARAEHELMGLLSDPSPTVRAAVLGLLANVPPIASAPLLGALRDKDTTVRAVACIALARRARYRGDRAGLAEIEAHALKARGGNERICAFGAQLLFEGPGRARAASELLGALPRAKRAPAFPWNDGNVLAWAFKALGRLASEEPEAVPPERLVEPLDAALHSPHWEEKSYTAAGQATSDLVCAIVEAMFGPKPGRERPCFTEPPPMPEELPKAKRMALQLLAETPHFGTNWMAFIGERLESAGFPMNREGKTYEEASGPGPLRRYLGLDPPGYWEQPIEGLCEGKPVRWPTYQWVRRIPLGLVRAEEFVKAAAGLPADKLVALAYALARSVPRDLEQTKGYLWPLTEELVVAILLERGPGCAKRSSNGWSLRSTAVTAWRSCCRSAAGTEQRVGPCRRCTMRSSQRSFREGRLRVCAGDLASQPRSSAGHWRSYSACRSSGGIACCSE